MSYDAAILQVLAEAGNDGLSVRKIAHHVLNACNSLFEPVEYTTVHAYVQQFLIRNSKTTNALIERTETRGKYRLNLNNVGNQQLMLQFCDEVEIEEEQNCPPEDLSLSLF